MSSKSKLSKLLRCSQESKRRVSLNMFKHFLFYSLLAWLSAAENYPNLTLPWGTWQATKYDSEGDVSAYV